MAQKVMLYDETVGRLGQRLPAFVLVCPDEILSARELIRARVLQEVQAYNDNQPEFFRSLVQPTGAEATLNGFRMPKRRQISPEAQVARALEAFEQNGFILLVNDQQVENLDDQIALLPETTITFLKLVPLVGG